MKVATGVDVVQKVAILCQLEHKKRFLLCLNDLKDLDDVGMADRLQNLNLSWQEFREILLSRNFFVEILNGNLQQNIDNHT